MAAANPLVGDRDVAFLLYEVHDVPGLCGLPAFASHDRETFDVFLSSAARLAREQLFPTLRDMDENPPRLVDGRVVDHPKMAELWRRIVDLGIMTASRSEQHGGASLPWSIAIMAYLYLMAGNGGAVGYALVTTGASQVIHDFGSEALVRMFLPPMNAGEWNGAVALTEAHAGSGLDDVSTSATPVEGRADVYRIKGSKTFISGGDCRFCVNTVHLTLARHVNDPSGARGLSLFVVPRMRPASDVEGLHFNDVHVSQLIHKLGWRGLPSLGLSFGDNDDCFGWLIGTPGKGLAYMFALMNRARLLVGANATATACAAYHESLAYARERTQGRRLDGRGRRAGPVAIIEHPDVRRMLLRQKAIVEGSMSLLVATARHADLAEHAQAEHERERSRSILDILSPVAKCFPAERGFESTVLAMQIHGGYGYSSEQLPELWLREQKLNSIHEGTTGIQSLDLLGRKITTRDGQPLRVLGEQIRADIDVARRCGFDEPLCDSVARELDRAEGLTRILGARAFEGDLVGMLAHSYDYLMLFSNLVIAWQWLCMAAAAQRGLGRDALGRDALDYYRGKLQAARYWIRTELADNARLAALCESSEDSYLEVPDGGW
jgi:butyryl-CoA dehydrogenase